MSYWKELLTQILRDMRQHKLRSILAMFGVMWGTIAVVLLLAVGEAYQKANKSTLLDIADNSLILIPGYTSKPYQGRPIGQAIGIKAAELTTLAQSLTEIHYISPIIETTNKTVLSRGNQQMSVAIQGVSADYGTITKQKPQSGGRFFNTMDTQLNRNVLFLENSVKEKLFGNASPLQQTVWLNGMPFNVIGVAQPEKPGAIGFGFFVYIPYTTAIQLWGDKNIGRVMLSTQHPQQVSLFKTKLTRYLSAKYHFDPNDQQAIYIVDLTQYTQFFTWFFATIQIFLALSGAITLGIGGIGVSNMMYLIVSERTPEIGLRLALGAKTHHILWQFLLESGVIVLLGSLVGLVISLASLQLLQHLSLPTWMGKPMFSQQVFFIAVMTLMVIAVITGYFPAKRAANLSPMQALAF